MSKFTRGELESLFKEVVLKMKKEEVALGHRQSIYLVKCSRIAYMHC